MQETNNINASENDIHHQMMAMMMMRQQQQEQIDEMDGMMVEDAYQFHPESVTQQNNNNRKPLLFPSLAGFASDSHNNSDSNLKATMDVVDAITKTLAAKTKNLQEMIKDKPKRPLSAYNLFFRMERDRILNNEPEREITFQEVAKISVMRRYSDGTKRQHRKTHGKVGFNELTRIISEKWKTIPSPIKEMFEERAVVEKTKYIGEIKEWKNSSKHNSKKEPTDMAIAATLSASTTEVSSPTAKAAGGKSKTVTPSRMNVTPSTGSPGSPLLPKHAYATSADGSSLDGSIEPVVISDISESEHHNGYYMSGGNVISDESNSHHDMMIMNSSGAVTLDDPFASSDYDNGNDHEFHHPSMMPTGMMNMNNKMMMPPRRFPNNPTRARLFQQQRNTTLGGSSRSIMPNKSTKHSRRRHSYAGGATFSPNCTFHNNSTNNMMSMMMMNNNYDYDAMYDNNIQPILHNALDECDEAFMMAESTLGGDAGVMMMNGDDDDATNFDQFDEFGNPACMFGSSRMNMNNEMMTMMMMPPPTTAAKGQMMMARHPGAMPTNKAMMMMSPPTDSAPLLRKRRHSTNGMMSPVFEGFPSFIDIDKMSNPTTTMITNSKSSDAISSSSEDDANDIQDNLGNKKIKLSHNRRKDLKGEQFSQSIFNDFVDM